MSDAATSTPRTQAQKAVAFRALHARSRAFVIPNPWDAGTAVLLARAGFEALATTSAGHAFSLGCADGTVGRAVLLAHVSSLAAATDLPVSADLGHGFGDDAEAVRGAIAGAAAAGAVGGSIEDVAPAPGASPYELAHAADRIRAAADAARALPFPFTLTARAENHLVGRPDLRDTIARLQAFQDAGADVLYAPGVRTLAELAEIVRSVDRPVNALAPLPGEDVTTAQLESIGVRRISVGSALARAAFGAVARAAREMREDGTFTFGRDASPYAVLQAMFTART